MNKNRLVFCFCFFLPAVLSARSRDRKKGGRGTKGEAERRVRKRRRKVEEECKEGSGVARNPARTLDWNLKVPSSIPGSTLREIIHLKTTKSQARFHSWVMAYSFSHKFFIKNVPIGYRNLFRSILGKKKKYCTISTWFNDMSTLVGHILWLRLTIRVSNWIE